MMSANKVGAVVLAAGLSQRMGQPKMILPWGKTTVIGQVISTLLAAQVAEVAVVTGGAHCQVEEVLQNMPVCIAFNAEYNDGQMLTSLRTGLRCLSDEVDAALIVLGDQPQIEARTVQEVVSVYRTTRAHLVVPSYQMRRGHPWVIARSLWQELLDPAYQMTMRDFLKAHADEICYHLVDTPSILADLDTPEDYARQRPVDQ